MIFRCSRFVFRNIIRLSNSLDLDQVRRFLVSDLDPKLLAVVNSRTNKQKKA